MLSVAPLLAHHICEHAGLPPPDLDLRRPIYTLHGGTTAVDAAKAQPAYLRAHRTGTPADQLTRQMREAGLNADDDSYSYGPSLDDDASNADESLTTASEYSATYSATY